MRRAHTREAGPAIETESVARRTAVEPGARSLIELQRTAGNRAVGSLLARDGDKVDTSGKGASATLVMPDPIGVIPLESYSMAANGEISVTAVSSGADPLLFEAGANGTFLDLVKLSSAGLELTLTGVVISSVQMSGGHVVFTLNPKSTEFKRPGEEPKGKPVTKAF